MISNRTPSERTCETDEEEEGEGEDKQVALSEEVDVTDSVFPQDTEIPVIPDQSGGITISYYNSHVFRIFCSFLTNWSIWNSESFQNPLLSTPLIASSSPETLAKETEETTPASSASSDNEEEDKQSAKEFIKSLLQFLSHLLHIELVGVFWNVILWERHSFIVLV